jgi:hypothetical protein
VTKDKENINGQFRVKTPLNKLKQDWEDYKSLLNVLIQNLILVLLL